MAAHKGPGITGNTLTVTTTPTAVVSRDDHPRRVVVQNVDPSNPVYLGGNSDASLTTSNGFRLAAGESFTADLPPLAELYAVSGSSVPVRFLVLDGGQF